MIVETKKVDVTRIGVVKKTACSMQVNAKAFEMLARQYSNPIKAIIQELAANAVDSHIRADKALVPFKVKLPNKLDPHFKIRDFGISMTPDVIYNTYTIYMKSDKTASNDETGCFGTGSKTPLAYTDSFNICTFIDGIKRMYTLSYNEQGIPELNEFTPVETKEANGVEVSFSVKEEDYQKFAENAINVLKFFEVAPEVIGNGAYQRFSFEKVLQGDNWYFTNEQKSFVVMGNTAYPISRYHFDYGKYMDILEAGVIMTLPIGALNITPSREALEYTKKTIGNIKNALDVVILKATKEIEKQVIDAKSLWSASLKALTYTKRFSFIDLKNIKWKTKALYNSFELPVAKAFHMNYNGRIKTENYNCKANHYVYVNNEVKIIFKDESKSHLAKIKHFVKVIDDKAKVFMIDPDVINTKDEKLAVTIDSLVKDTKALTGITDTDNVIMFTSKMEKPPKVARPKGQAKAKNAPIQVREFCIDRNGNYERYRSYNSRYWKTVENFDIANATEFIYVDFDRYEVSVNNEVLSMPDIYKGFVKLGITIPKIYAVTKKYKKKVESNTNAIDFIEWSKTVLTKSMQNKLVNNQATCEMEEITLAKKIVSFITIKDKKSDFAKFLELCKNHKKKDSYEHAFLNLFKKVTGIDIDSIVADTTIVKLINTIKEKYALVMYFLNNTGYINDNEIKKYAKDIEKTVNAIDKA